MVIKNIAAFFISCPRKAKALGSLFHRNLTPLTFLFKIFLLSFGKDFFKNKKTEPPVSAARLSMFCRPVALRPPIYIGVCLCQALFYLLYPCHIFVTCQWEFKYFLQRNLQRSAVKNMAITPATLTRPIHYDKYLVDK